MPAKKAPKLVTVTAQYPVDKDFDGTMMLWGVPFKASKGKLTAKVDSTLAKEMKDCKRVK